MPELRIEMIPKDVWNPDWGYYANERNVVRFLSPSGKMLTVKTRKLFCLDCGELQNYGAPFSYTSFSQEHKLTCPERGRFFKKNCTSPFTPPPKPISRSMVEALIKELS